MKDINSIKIIQEYQKVIEWLQLEGTLNII